MLQGYFLGNPTTDNTKNYMLAELYQGMSLISEDLLHSLHRSSCPAHGRSKDGGGNSRQPVDETYTQTEGADLKASLSQLEMLCNIPTYLNQQEAGGAPPTVSAHPTGATRTLELLCAVTAQ
jgi:hypothetical protein